MLKNGGGLKCLTHMPRAKLQIMIRDGYHLSIYGHRLVYQTIKEKLKTILEDSKKKEG